MGRVFIATIRDLKIDVHGKLNKQQTLNRILTSTIRCSNLGQLRCPSQKLGIALCSVREFVSLLVC